MSLRQALFLIGIFSLQVTSGLAVGEDKAAAAGRQFNERLAAASLAEQKQLLREWAISVVLPDLGSLASKVDDKFAGVKATGRRILSVDYSQPVDVAALTYRNADYWRGVVEMAPGNPLIAALPAFLHLANGEWDQAGNLLEPLRACAQTGTIPAAYVADAVAHLATCNKSLTREIQRGIALHDAGKFTEAMAVYQAILDTGIRSAWARYELFFSRAQSGGKQKFVEIMSGRDSGAGGWDAAAMEIYAINPLYTTQMTGRRGKDMAALIDRMTLKMLESDKKLSPGKKLATFADLALKLEAYPVAAHLYWLSISVKDTGLSIDEQILRFLYCLNRLGVDELQKQFKGDFPKMFKKLDKELTKHRTG